MTQTTLANLLPDLNRNPGISRGYIQDVQVNLQTDHCTNEACPALRLHIDLDGLQSSPRVYKIDQESLKNIRRVYGDKVSNWLNQEITVCHIKKEGRTCFRVLPPEMN